MTASLTGGLSFPRLRPAKLALAAVLALAACATSPGLLSLGTDVSQSAVQFSLARLDRTWSSPRGSLVAIQRGLGSEGEQVIGLSNATTLSGDNFLWMRARIPDGRSAGRLQLDDLLSRAGGVPTPFRNVNNQNLNNATDRLGPYFWLEYQTGTATNCVLAFRRVTVADRVLPRGTNVMEALLRNCVNGPVEDALGPIGADQIGLAANASAAAPSGGNRMLSPLAAPQN